MSDITDIDRKLIDELRSESKHLLDEFPEYDTDYNILRFIKGHNYVKPNCLYWFQRHLKTKRVFDLKHIHDLPDDDIVREYFPSGLLGTTGKDNMLIMIEAVGRSDVDGLLKCVQATDFFRYRMKYMEQVFKAINEQERSTNHQSGVIYIFDLEGITFNPFLIPVLTGPYLSLWGFVMMNYPEWINLILVVNVPTFFSVLWNAFGTLIPENTRNKIKVMGNDWKKEILDYIDPQHLPVNWGGKMVDENGDPMCRSKIVVPRGKIPESLYWQNTGKYKELPDNQVKFKYVPAGGHVIMSYFVPEPGTVLKYYLHSNDTYAMVVHYSDDTKEADPMKMDEVFPQIQVPGGLAPDSYQFICERPGAYHIKLINEKSWFFSITIKYLWRWLKQDGSPAMVIPLNDEAKE